MGDTNGAHRCALSHTNTSGVVAVCRCGWQSLIHRPPIHHVAGGGAGYLDYAAAERTAVLDYIDHLGAERRRAALAVNERTRLGELARQRFGHA